MSEDQPRSSVGRAGEVEQMVAPGPVEPQCPGVGDGDLRGPVVGTTLLEANDRDVRHRNGTVPW